MKIALTNLVLETKMNWIKCHPLALIRIRTIPRTDIGVSPCETVFALPFLTTNQTGTDKEGDSVQWQKLCADYCKHSGKLEKRGYLPQSTSTDFKIHLFHPGDGF